MAQQRAAQDGQAQQGKHRGRAAIEPNHPDRPEAPPDCAGRDRQHQPPNGRTGENADDQ